MVIDIIQSPINYSGSKFKLLDKLIPMFPATPAFMDMFTGGGSVYMNVANYYNEVFANDSLQSIIDIHKNIFSDEYVARAALESVYTKDDQSAYTELRNRFNETGDTCLLLALIWSCNSNMMRFNNKGMFNQTWGKRSYNANTEAKMKVLKNQNFNNVEFSHSSFDNILIPDECFVYLDPPYSNTLTGYTRQWTTDEENRLIDLLADFIEKGTLFGISGIVNDRPNPIYDYLCSVSGLHTVWLGDIYTNIQKRDRKVSEYYISNVPNGVISVLGEPVAYLTNGQYSMKKDCIFGITPEELAQRGYGPESTHAIRYLTPLPSTVTPDVVHDLELIITDVETTGLDRDNDEIISIGFLRVSFSEDCTQVSVIEADTYYNEPEHGISQEITDLTGLTMDTVSGHTLTMEQMEYIFGKADVVAAHNAKFDRGFVDRYYGRAMHWVCTVNDLDLRKLYGTVSSSLASVMAQAFGYYMHHHEALPDCYACYELVKDQNNLDTLIERLLQPRYTMIATGAAFNKKDILKQNGFRWDASNKHWYKNAVTDATMQDTTALVEECGGTPDIVSIDSDQRHRQGI